MTVTMTVRYTLLDYSSNDVIYRKDITKPYTATMSDTFAGITRLRMANEGSARKNIHTFLKELEKINY